RGSRIQAIEYRLLHQRRVRFIGMPNIILDRVAFPEMIQEQASPERLAEAALPFLTDPTVREKAKAGLRRIPGTLGEPGAREPPADLILDLISKRSAISHQRSATTDPS